jgi:hypothetical protein
MLGFSAPISSSERYLWRLRSVPRLDVLDRIKALGLDDWGGAPPRSSADGSG